MKDFLLNAVHSAASAIAASSTEIVARDKGGIATSHATAADLAAEAALISCVRNAYPDDDILAEETTSIIPDPRACKRLWVIDPIDGTTNFIFGLDLYCISIAYVEWGVVKAGAIYRPAIGEFFWTEENQGAWLGNKRLYIREHDGLTDALINVGAPYAAKDFACTAPGWHAFHAAGARVVNFGVAALECAFVAASRLSGYCETNLKPWDIAAGTLLIAEAGGCVEALTGRFDIFTPTTLLAGSCRVVEAMRRALEEKVID